MPYKLTVASLNMLIILICSNTFARGIYMNNQLAEIHGYKKFYAVHLNPHYVIIENDILPALIDENNMIEFYSGGNYPAD